MKALNSVMVPSGLGAAAWCRSSLWFLLSNKLKVTKHSMDLLSGK